MTKKGFYNHIVADDDVSRAAAEILSIFEGVF